MNMKLNLHIGGKKRSVPLSWSEITVSQFQDLNSIDSKLPYIEQMKLILCALFDLEIEVVSSIPLADIVELSSVLSWTSIPPVADLVKGFTHRGKRYRLINLDSLTLGEWLDLNHWCEDVSANLHCIAAILYRPVKRRFFNTIVEGYDSDSAAVRAEDFRTLPLNIAWGALEAFLKPEKESQRLIPGNLFSWRTKMLRRARLPVLKTLTHLFGSLLPWRKMT